MLLQGYQRVSTMISTGITSILRALKAYQQQSTLLKAWQDVFVDLVQGQLQHLFLSLLAGGLPDLPELRVSKLSTEAVAVTHFPACRLHADSWLAVRGCRGVSWG